MIGKSLRIDKGLVPIVFVSYMKSAEWCSCYAKHAIFTASCQRPFTTKIPLNFITDHVLFCARGNFLGRMKREEIKNPIILVHACFVSVVCCQWSLRFCWKGKHESQFYFVVFFHNLSSDFFIKFDLVFNNNISWIENRI